MLPPDAPVARSRGQMEKEGVLAAVDVAAILVAFLEHVVEGRAGGGDDQVALMGAPCYGETFGGAVGQRRSEVPGAKQVHFVS